MARKLIKEVQKEKRHNMIYQIPKDIVADFAKDCLALQHYVKVDELDCSKSFARQKSELSLDEAFNVINNASFRHYSFILRTGFHSQFGGWGAQYFEFCSSGEKDSVEYFVWIEVEKEDGLQLVEKYKLKKNDEL